MRDNSIIALLRDENGMFGLGEATPAQPDYQEESPESIWCFVTQHANRLLGGTTSDAFEYLLNYKEKFPFACTAFMTALEEIDHNPVITAKGEVSFPLVGIVNPDAGESLEEHLGKRLEQGFKTLKIKIGYDVDKDIEKVRKIQKYVGNRAKLRLDANQAYSYEDAVKFVESIDGYNIELLEQPFGCGIWDAMADLKKISKLPLMLDESIYNIEDVRMAGEKNCADYIKFKLMKSSCGSLMSKEIELATSYGITALIGNGVSTDIGCYQESLIAHYCGMKNAGEQNGFLKPRETLLVEKLQFKNGCMIIPEKFSRELDMDVIKHYSIHEAHYSL